jgi:hypothetical protein
MGTYAHVYVSIRQHALAGTITNGASITCLSGPYHPTFFSAPPLPIAIRPVTHPPRLCPPTSGMRRRWRRKCRGVLCQHTSAYVSIRQHTPAYVSIRQHTSAYVSIRQYTSAYVRIRHHTSSYVSIRCDAIRKQWHRIGILVESEIVLPTTYGKARVFINETFSTETSYQLGLIVGKLGEGMRCCKFNSTSNVLV